MCCNCNKYSRKWKVDKFLWFIFFLLLSSPRRKVVTLAQLVCLAWFGSVVTLLSTLFHLNRQWWQRIFLLSFMYFLGREKNSTVHLNTVSMRTKTRKTKRLKWKHCTMYVLIIVQVCIFARHKNDGKWASLQEKWKLWWCVFLSTKDSNRLSGIGSHNSQQKKMHMRVNAQLEMLLLIRIYVAYFTDYIA